MAGQPLGQGVLIEGDHRRSLPWLLPVTLGNSYLLEWAQVLPGSRSHISPCPWQKLDLERETIELVHTEPTEVAQLPSRVPRDAARYHFFLYKHTHEGDPLESVGEWPQQGSHTCVWTGMALAYS